MPLTKEMVKSPEAISSIMTKVELHLKPIYRFEYCTWTHNDKICEFIHQGRDFITKDESCKGSRTKLNFVGKAFKIVTIGRL